MQNECVFCNGWHWIHGPVDVGRECVHCKIDFSELQVHVTRLKPKCGCMETTKVQSSVMTSFLTVCLSTKVQSSSSVHMRTCQLI